jgi:hypothetical protein
MEQGPTTMKMRGSLRSRMALIASRLAKTVSGGLLRERYAGVDFLGGGHQVEGADADVFQGLLGHDCFLDGETGGSTMK